MRDFNDLSKKLQKQQIDIQNTIGNSVKQFQRQQIDIQNNLGNSVKQFQRQQIDIQNTLGNLVKQFQRQQIDIKNTIGNSVKQFQRQQIDIQNTLGDSIKKFQLQQINLNKVIENYINLNISNIYKVNSFNGGIVVLDNIVDNIQEDLIDKCSRGENYDSYETMDYYIEVYSKLSSKIKNGYKVLRNNEIVKECCFLFGVFGSIVTLATPFIKDNNNLDIHTHNNFENIDINTKIEGKNIEIYIEKKEETINDTNEIYDDWLSGGERT